MNIRLEWIWSATFVLLLILEWPQGSLRDSEWFLRSPPRMSEERQCSLQIHSKFTHFTAFLRRPLKEEHSFLFREWLLRDCFTCRSDSGISLTTNQFESNIHSALCPIWKILMENLCLEIQSVDYVRPTGFDRCLLPELLYAFTSIGRLLYPFQGSSDMRIAEERQQTNWQTVFYQNKHFAARYSIIQDSSLPRVFQTVS